MCTEVEGVGCSRRREGVIHQAVCIGKKCKVVEDNGSFYEVKLERGEKTIVAQITADGKVQKTEEEKEGSDDKD